MSYLSEYYPDASAQDLLLLEQLWNDAMAIEPEAIEGLSYGLPGLKLGNRPLVGFGLHDDFMSIYPYSPKIITALHKGLVSFETTKGTIRFTLENPLSSSIVELIIDLRKVELGNNSYKKKQYGIEVELKDPIFDVMSDKEIDEANKRISDLLENEGS